MNKPYYVVASIHGGFYQTVECSAVNCDGEFIYITPTDHEDNAGCLKYLNALQLHISDKTYVLDRDNLASFHVQLYR